MKLEIENQIAQLVSSSDDTFILGITGSPAAGKTTLAQQLVESFALTKPDWFASYLPMDGFHLSNKVLTDISLLDRKGAPETFDVAGYDALLRRIKVNNTDEIIYAPDFDRSLDESIAGRIAISPKCRLVITEGIHLANQALPWRLARQNIDELWYLDIDESVARSRLIDRQLEGGKDAQQAEHWYESVDKLNVTSIRTVARYCDRSINQEDLSQLSSPNRVIELDRMDRFVRR